MLSRLLDGALAPRLLPVTAAVSLALSLAFIFVWSPHPFGRYGIDHYHELAIALAEGAPFPTMHVPWGYAYFLAAFYRVFGPDPVYPLVAQALANAALPWLLYRFARPRVGPRLAMAAAWLLSVFSFNTIYTSTLSTDSICTVLVMLAVLALPPSPARHPIARLAAAGLLVGLAAQFRPNLILLPGLLAALHVAGGRDRARRAAQALALLLAAATALAPWTLRNYRLTGEIIPTSTHGGVQLWYGTLQVGPHLESRAHNPRRLFESAAFDYSSLLDTPLIVEASVQACAPAPPEALALVYSVDGHDAGVAVPMTPSAPGRYRGVVPASGRPRLVTFYFESQWPDAAGGGTSVTPPGGAADPFVYFQSEDHLGDLDQDDHLLDVFDVARLLRHLAWQEPVRAAGQLDLDGNGALDEADLRRAAELLLPSRRQAGPPVDPIPRVAISPAEVRAVFFDGSSLTVPRAWDGRVTDLGLEDGAAATLATSVRRFSALGTATPPAGGEASSACLELTEVAVNDVFYRRQPHEMRRYAALAWDNVRRAPVDYAWSVAYRAVRLFVVRGSADPMTTQQFAGGRLVYLAATLASLAYLGLFAAGVVIAWGRGLAVGLPLALVLYIPATLAFVLTNMRYTVTVQPYLFVFVAVALVTGLDRLAGRAPGTPAAGAAPRRAGNGTARRP